MKLIAGLGNPGSKYELNRHNIGFIVLDLLSDNLGLTFKAGKGDWFYAQGKIDNEDFILLKPTTFMNNSGAAVKEFADSHDIKYTDMLLIYDDFQLPLGTIRVRRMGSDGGHNGIKNIIYHLNTIEFPRMRIGIGPEEIIKGEDYVDYVLSNFNDNEIEIIKQLLPHYFNCIINFLTKDIVQVMNEYNRSFITKE